MFATYLILSFLLWGEPLNCECDRYLPIAFCHPKPLKIIKGKIVFRFIKKGTAASKVTRLLGPAQIEAGTLHSRVLLYDELHLQIFLFDGIVADVSRW